MSDPASEGSSPKRRCLRMRCAVTILFQTGTVYGQGHLADLSPDGVRVVSALRQESGDGIRIRFTTPEGQKIELAGNVVWSRAGEFGVCIVQSDEAYLSFVESLSAPD